MGLSSEESTEVGRDPAQPFGVGDVILTVVAGIALGLVALFILSVAIDAFLGPGENLSYVTSFSVVSAVLYGSFLVSVYGLIVRRRDVSWTQLGVRPPSRGFFLKTVGLLVAVIVCNAITATLIQELVGEPPDVREQLSLEPGTGFSIAEILWLAFALIVAAPLVEEILFRGLLLPALRIRWSFWPAAGVSSVVFALAHVSPLLIPTLFVLGLALAWLREHFDSVYPPIVMHALNNGLAVVILVASAPS